MARDAVSDTAAPSIDAWQAWTPAEAAERLATVGVPWCVVGGWSIDLSLGEVTRQHDDLEIEVMRDDWPAVRDALADFDFYVAGSGLLHFLPRGERPPADHHQTWVFDVAAQRWRIDVMLEAGDADTWVCRRESIAAPRSWMMGVTPDGIPHLRAHGALLYKAKAARPKDEADFETCLPRLGDEERRWLADALERAHPGHPWIARLR